MRLSTASGPSAFHVVVGIASQAILISFYRLVRGGVGDLEESILWVVTAVATVWLLRIGSRREDPALGKSRG